MAKRECIVIGGSAGAIETLVNVIRELPADLPAAVLVVVHVPAQAVSRLPAILDRAGPLPAAHALHGEAVVQGRVYIAPPDWHMLVHDGAIELTHGPRENHSRPSIDPLFRSAARAYASGVVGVILSGALYDGAAGLASITSRGGVAIVQDPAEAPFPSMPNAALKLAEVDLVLPAMRIGEELRRLVSEEVDNREGVAMIDDDERMTQVIALDFAKQAGDQRPHEPTMFTCPDCGGVLWQVESGPRARFRCHVGHAYVPEALLGQKSEELEAALWSCIRLLREKATLTRQTATRYVASGQEDLASRLEEHASLNDVHADEIRKLLEAMPGSGDQLAAEFVEIGGSD